jgi:predicted nucleic acid-binding protein
MATYYLDSSALVKRYAQEVGSSWITNLINPVSSNGIFTALVSGAEIVAAIARKVRTGAIPQQAAATAITIFKNHFRAEYLIVMTTPTVVESAMHLAEKHGLRGYDAIQLASALSVQSELSLNGVNLSAFISSDVNLNKAALAEGLGVENPQEHP